MLRIASLMTLVVLMAATAKAQESLSDFFELLRTVGPNPSENAIMRGTQIVQPFATGKKSLDGEWPAINTALNDSRPFVRDQACTVLALIAFVRSSAVYGPPQRIQIPDDTKALIAERFNEPLANTRESAVRIVASMAGGVPLSLVPQLLQLARTDAQSNVRSVAIEALASIPIPAPEITQFWIEALSDAANRQARANILNAFRNNAPSDSRVIALVIEALRDKDYFVRQEAIASVVKIGKPAVAALPLLVEIRDTSNGPSEMDVAMRQNAESAIRKLTDSIPPAH